MNEELHSHESTFDIIRQSPVWEWVQTLGVLRSRVNRFHDGLYDHSVRDICDFFSSLGKDLDHLQRHVISPNHDVTWMDESPEILKFLKSAHHE